jgi:hypothetical protein
MKSADFMAIALGFAIAAALLQVFIVVAPLLDGAR